MAAWEWIEADEHIEWAFDEEGIPDDARFKPAISFEPMPQRCSRLDDTKYASAGFVLLRISAYDELGQNARTEFIMKELGPAILEARS